MLDLFAGLGGWHAAFADRGHDVVSVDNDPSFGCTVTADLLTVPTAALGSGYDIVLASPPCEAFSVAAFGHHWSPGRVPKTQHAMLSVQLVHRTLVIIEALAPTAWVIENPRGMLRKLGILSNSDRVTVWHCRYGDDVAKPTDLWLGGQAREFYFEPECSNGSHDHDRAPRGSRVGGTQGRKDASTRAVIPYGLSLAVCLQAERMIDGSLVPGRLT